MFNRSAHMALFLELANRVDEVFNDTDFVSSRLIKAKTKILKEQHGNDFPMEACYACAYNDSINDKNCDNCPLDIGLCGTDNGNLYDCIRDSVLNKDKESFIHYCRKMAYAKVKEGIEYC